MKFYLNILVKINFMVLMKIQELRVNNIGFRCKLDLKVHSLVARRAGSLPTKIGFYIRSMPVLFI